jgi:hypothetical protein
MSLLSHGVRSNSPIVSTSEAPRTDTPLPTLKPDDDLLPDLSPQTPIPRSESPVLQKPTRDAGLDIRRPPHSTLETARRELPIDIQFESVYENKFGATFAIDRNTRQCSMTYVEPPPPQDPTTSMAVKSRFPVSWLTFDDEEIAARIANVLYIAREHSEGATPLTIKASPGNPATIRISADKFTPLADDKALPQNGRRHSDAPRFTKK